MEIKIKIQEAQYGKFSDIKLCFTDAYNAEREVNLFIDFLPLYDFSKDTTSIRFDFFLLSSIVYGIDNLVNRDTYSVDGWAREIDITFPVYNLKNWAGQEKMLERILGFLTGDYWQIKFTKLNLKNIFIEKQRRWKRNIPSYEKKQVKVVSLFSGGLDSLIGVINYLEQLGQNEKIVFASHFDSNSAGPNSDQTRLEDRLSTKYPNKINWIQSTVTLSRHDSSGNPIQVEDSYRSRSFLFIGIGLYLCTPDISTNELIIPENGTISINYPLTPSRVSSLSTRTTHPFVIQTLQYVISNIGININLYNPYYLKTKGEMVKECLNSSVLNKIYELSVSCGKRGRRNHWDITSGTDHCGICMPCIYRRAALHKKGWDNQTYGVDILSASDIRKYVDMPALFDYLKTNLSIEKIKRDLLVNGSLPIDQLEAYAEVVSKSRKEVLKWFANKGNLYIKGELGIR